MENEKSYGPPEYTFEDYLKDFEFDYLGFDGVPGRSVPGHSAEKLTGNEAEQETGVSKENEQKQHPCQQDWQNIPANSKLLK